MMCLNAVLFMFLVVGVYFLFPSICPSRTSIIHILGHMKLSHNSLTLCSLFLLLFFLSVILDSFYLYVLKLTDLFLEIPNLSIPSWQGIPHLRHGSLSLYKFNYSIFFFVSFMSLNTMFLASNYLNIWNSGVVAILMSLSTNSMFCAILVQFGLFFSPHMVLQIFCPSL